MSFVFSGVGGGEERLLVGGSRGHGDSLANESLEQALGLGQLLLVNRRSVMVNCTLLKVDKSST
jgi:hypothetical protein